MEHNPKEQHSMTTLSMPQLRRGEEVLPAWRGKRKIRCRACGGDSTAWALPWHPVKCQHCGAVHREPRNELLLRLLAEAAGPTYDELCREMAASCPADAPWKSSQRGVRVVRWAMWYGLAATEPDETVWLTAAGWRAAEAWAEVAK